MQREGNFAAARVVRKNRTDAIFRRGLFLIVCFNHTAQTWNAHISNARHGKIGYTQKCIPFEFLGPTKLPNNNKTQIRIMIIFIRM